MDGWSIFWEDLHSNVFLWQEGGVDVRVEAGVGVEDRAPDWRQQHAPRLHHTHKNLYERIVGFKPFWQ